MGINSFNINEKTLLSDSEIDYLVNFLAYGENVKQNEYKTIVNNSPSLWQLVKNFIRL